MENTVIKTIAEVLAATSVMGTFAFTSNAAEVPDQMDTPTTEGTLDASSWGLCTPEQLDEMAPYSFKLFI